MNMEINGSSNGTVAYALAKFPTPLEAKERVIIEFFDGNSYVFDLNSVQNITIESIASLYEIVKPNVETCSNQPQPIRTFKIVRR